MAAHWIALRIQRTDRVAFASFAIRQLWVSVKKFLATRAVPAFRVAETIVAEAGTMVTPAWTTFINVLSALTRLTFTAYNGRVTKISFCAALTMPTGVAHNAVYALIL